MSLSAHLLINYSSLIHWYLLACEQHFPSQLILLQGWTGNEPRFFFESFSTPCASAKINSIYQLLLGSSACVLLTRVFSKCEYISTSLRCFLESLFLFYTLVSLWYSQSEMTHAHKDSNLSGWLNCPTIRLFQGVEKNHSLGGKVQVGGVALAHGGEWVGSFVAYRSLGGPLISSHYLGLLTDYHFNYSMRHVRGNFDLKTMTVRVGSGPLSLVSGPW